MEKVNVEFISSVEVVIINLPKRSQLFDKKLYSNFIGLAKFVNLFMNPLLWNNPNVQILTIYDQTPTPFIEVHLDKTVLEKPVYVDCLGKNEIEILQHLQRVFGKTHEQIKYEKDKAKPKTDQFGPATVLNIIGCVHDCLCRAEVGSF